MWHPSRNTEPRIDLSSQHSGVIPSSGTGTEIIRRKMATPAVPAVSITGNEDSQFVLLPPELILTILSLLPLLEKLCVRLTCRRLYSLASDTSLWNHVAWRCCIPADEKLLKTALKLSAPHVRELQLHATTGYLGYSKISGILKRCRNLRSLSLRGFNVKANQLKTLVSALPQLSDVRIGKSLKTYLSRHCMRNYMEAAKSLKSLIIEIPNSIYWLDSFTFETEVSHWASLGYCPPEFGMIIKSFRSPYLLRDTQHLCLRDPHFNQLPPSSHKARFCLYTTGLPMDLSPLQPVCELTFHRSCMFAHGESIGLPQSHFMLSLMGKTLESENYTIARSFALESGFPCQSSQIASFTTFSHHLTTLKLENLVMSSVHLELIADACPNLTDLDISSSCTEAFKCLQGLAAIAHKCTQLKGLTIDDETKPSDVESIPAFWEILAQIRKLKYLTVSDGLLRFHSNLDADVNSQSNIRLKRSFQQMKSLCALQVQCCAVTNRELSMLSNLVSLTYLRLSDLPPSQIGLEEILGKAQQLKYLYISKSNGGKLTLPTHASCYTNLEQVYIRCWNFAVTDVLVKALVHSGKLTHLFLLIGSISQRNITDLIQNLPRLAVCHIYVNVTVGPRGSAKQFKTALQLLVKARGLAQFDFKPNMCRRNSIALCSHVDELLDYTELTPLQLSI